MVLGMKTGWLIGGIAAALIVTVSGCGKSSSGPVTLFQWQDYMEPPFLADYEKAYGEKPAITIFADEDEAFSKMRAGFKPDVMGPCYYEFPRWKEADLLEPIDISKLKNWNKIAPTLRNLPGISAGPGKVWFVPHYWGNTSLTIRTDLAPEYAKSQNWDILFDPKYKGRVSVMDGVDDTVPFIARMAGVNAYEMSEADWAKVQAKLRELVPHLRFVSSDDTALAPGLGRVGGGDELAHNFCGAQSRAQAGGVPESTGRHLHLCLRVGDAQGPDQRSQSPGADRFLAVGRRRRLHHQPYRR